ncbi:MAG: helix-turn-helix transcriptional regulator [Anaerocolumna sp.]|jgi:transcriptional regulator with XRE-family HTH domain|nr:helix-turn-helix transcriptional regulator [Anaerocolumna sp.]
MFDVIGINVRDARISHGWSQRFVASQINVSHQSISRLENGYPVSSSLLKKVVGLLQISLSDVYQDKKDNKTLSYAIPDEVMSKMILNSQPLVECIYNEAVLRYKQQLKKKGILLQEDMEYLIEEYFGKRKSYSMSDLIYAGMLSNQKTLENAILI